MKFIMTIAAALISSLTLSCSADLGYQPESGDIIFHTSKSAQSSAIQLATKSKYSHMGIVYVLKGEPFVFEAVEPVKTTPLKEWVARGEDGHYVVKRLANATAVLSPEGLARMQKVGESFTGKHYDLYFGWSDERIYCSELVWKIFKRGLGVEIGALETLGDFDLSSPEAHQKLQERWGGKPPLEEQVISPAAMFDSDLLVEVHRE
ncbi:YiiX family permuted papain-like enzyme [Porticoccus sp. GXU_MW_L64]